MKKYRVIQSYSGVIDRVIEAEDEEEAEQKMMNIPSTFQEIADCIWEYPEVIEEITDA